MNPKLQIVPHGAVPMALLALTWVVGAQTAVQDDFESGQFDPAWALTSGVQITGADGARGTIYYARLGAGMGLGARFDVAAPGEARDFEVDCFFRVRDSTNRQFNLFVSDSTGPVTSGAATINLRFQANTWSAYDTAWRPLSGLGNVTVGAWHRLRLKGRNWGNGAPSFDVELSDAGGTAFSSRATNVTVFQNGNPSNNPARFFVFTSVFGNSPGFDVDEVTATVTATNPPPPAESNAILNISGTYPHLTIFSGEGECGIGAVVPWADRLWFVTYPPHHPNGGPDKLWTVDSNLTLTARPESVGGTHANRLIHRESQQLNIGPYFIATNGTVRAVPPATLRGRLTGAARHLTDPANRLYLATMEEGLYEVDVNTLAVTELYHDMNTAPGPGQRAAELPGVHGKGLYSAQRRLIYSNNGSGGSLNTWDGTNWTTVHPAKFTEVTGPGGLLGNPPEDDRLWALGWDARSVILKLLQDGTWHTYRLPKASYTHDADHGWFTEWPRIREVTPGRLLAHMHGMFYRFPKTFSVANTAGLQPLCAYLKMPVDYCWWNGQLVMGRDDASTTGGNKWAGQSHSALWFGQFSDLESWGPPAGFGGPWVNDAVTGNSPSDPFFVGGFQRRVLHVKHATPAPVNFAIEMDAHGTGQWSAFTNLSVPANGYVWLALPASLTAPWLRLVPDRDAQGVTAYFHLGNPPRAAAPELFAGIASAEQTGARSDGILRPKSGDARTLQFAANFLDPTGVLTGTGYYEIGGAFQLRRLINATAETALRTTYSLSNASFTVDAASVIYTEGTNRFRLPKGAAAYDSAFASGWPRGAREVVTERQLFNAHGTFYELPYGASGGFRRIRPVATHNRHISDFASWRGLFVIAGLAAEATNNGHVFRSDDGRAALWFGNVDDLWRLGPPAGRGGPWKNSAVTAGAPSDPYLMFGYEPKMLELAHAETAAVTFIVEVDVAADNTWCEYARFSVPPGRTFRHRFPDGYSAHWVRLKTDTDATVTATFLYGPAAPELGGLAPRADGAVRLTLRGMAGDGYTVRASTNLATPLPNWDALHAGVFGFEPVVFDDLLATNLRQRFYLISIP